MAQSAPFHERIPRRNSMTGISPAVVHLSGGNLVLVIIVFLIALGALAMAYMFRQEVLAAGEGTDNMKNIAHAVQEGANAYLTRQFRTLAVFAVVARRRPHGPGVPFRVLPGRRGLLRDGRVPRHEPRRACQPAGRRGGQRA